MVINKIQEFCMYLFQINHLVNFYIIESFHILKYVLLIKEPLETEILVWKKSSAPQFWII